MKQVSIIGATFNGNRGAEAMLSTTIAILSKNNPATLFNVFSYYPTIDKQLVNQCNVRIYSATPLYLVTVLFPLSIVMAILKKLKLTCILRLMPKSVQAMFNARVLLCLAGVSFIDGREKFLPYNILTLLPAILARVPVIKMAQALGPFNYKPNRFLSHIFLERCSQIFARGDLTHQNLLSLFGNDTSTINSADDIAFLFEPRFCISQTYTNIHDRLAHIHAMKDMHKPIIGICPSVVIANLDTTDYLDNMINLVSALVKLRYCVVIYPNATRCDDMNKTHNNDLPLIKAMALGLSHFTKDQIVYFQDSLNAGQIHSIVSVCDTHIVSRFHAMVMALSLKKPLLVIGWSHKYLEVMKRFKQQDMVLDYNASDIDIVIKQVNTLTKEQQERQGMIEVHLEQVKHSARSQFNYIEKLLLQ